jgi:hypothetical protein
MTPSEKQAKEQFEREGWTALHKGAPDFLLIKTDEMGVVKQIAFREVKNPGDKLRSEQVEWGKALVQTGLDHKVIGIDKEGKVKPIEALATPKKSRSNKGPKAMISTYINWTEEFFPTLKVAEAMAAKKGIRLTRLVRQALVEYVQNHKGDIITPEGPKMTNEEDLERASKD